jgi:ribosomal protein L35AE/L33A
MNKASIGRHVHYTDNNGNVLAAVIARVHSDDCVSLVVFDTSFTNGTTVTTSVLRKGSEHARTDGRFVWDWPQRD